jgi:hypothetical protein
MSRPGSAVTERDIQVLVDVYKHRYLSVSQIQRLHFPSLQTAYRRLRGLTALGYLVGFTAPAISEHLYYLGKPGMDLVAQAMGVGMSDLKWQDSPQSPKDYYFLRHFMGVNDIRISLSQACEQSGIQLLGFIPEYYGQKTAAGGLVKYIKDFVCDVKRPQEAPIPHTPDAVFALEKNHVPALFFLEVDRGTEVVGDERKGVLKCVRFYLNYLLSGKYQRYSQDFGSGEFKGFRTLIVTTTQIRIDNMRLAASNLAFGEKAKKFIWLTDQEQASRNIFDPIWRSADMTDSTRYRIG